MTSTNGWSLVPLGEAVTHRKEFVQIDDLSTYKRCRVQLHAQGVVLRDEVEGSLIKTKSQQVCRTNEFLVAEIDAKMGGFGLVPPELEGAVVSSHYFLFTPKLDRLDPQFLGYYCRTPAFREQVTSRGTTNYAAIRPSHVLGYTIPLPPLEEQRRIVARIDRLAAKIEEALALRSRAGGEQQAMLSRANSALFEAVQAPRHSLGDLLREKSRNGLSIAPRSGPPGHQILRISAGTSRDDGVVDESDFKFVDANENELRDYTLECGDLLACRFNGNLHYVGKFSMFTGYSGQQLLHPDKLIRFRVDSRRVLPEYVRDIMNSSLGRVAIETFCQTTAGNIGISAKNLNTVMIPVPPLEEQQRIANLAAGLKSRRDELKQMHRQTVGELNAMLPSILDRAFKGAL
jgi:type I restriction enzyme S subunit